MHPIRFLLVGIAAVLLATAAVGAVLCGRGGAESPQDLADRAVRGDSPCDRAEAATALAARAHATRPDGAADIIAALRRTLQEGGSAEVRATAIVGLGRTGDRRVLPIVVTAVEDADPLVAGRAVAAAQHLLGVRYEVPERALDRDDRRRIAEMARADTAALDGPGRAWWEAHTIQGATW